jgi:hypothetical protein
LHRRYFFHQPNFLPHIYMFGLRIKPILPSLYTLRYPFLSSPKGIIFMLRRGLNNMSTCMLK